MRGALEAIADERERWRAEARLDEWLHRFGLDRPIAPERASGGERKRAALALAFALEPDMLLLDEPTNHLDIDAIAALEEFLARGPAAIVVTHDRWFLDRVATRIVELDRGLLRSYPGNFTAYETRKADQLAAESVANRRFDKFWAQEEVWIRKGVEARRTRNEGRVRRLEQLRRDRTARRDRLGDIRVQVDAGERSGKLVAELEDVSKRFGDRVPVRDLSLRIMRGDRLGLIGPNGAGKTTLIRLLLGELAARRGHGAPRHQARGRVLRPAARAARSGAHRRRHHQPRRRLGRDQRPAQARAVATSATSSSRRSARPRPCSMLSGGERNRLLLARLFARPANLLVLDEPTNDLDIETLELLERRCRSTPARCCW